jgi:hypothetical protein
MQGRGPVAASAADPIKAAADQVSTNIAALLNRSA